MRVLHAGLCAGAFRRWKVGGVWGIGVCRALQHAVAATSSHASSKQQAAWVVFPSHYRGTRGVYTVRRVCCLRVCLCVVGGGGRGGQKVELLLPKVGCVVRFCCSLRRRVDVDKCQGRFFLWESKLRKVLDVYWNAVEVTKK